MELPTAKIKTSTSGLINSRMFGVGDLSVIFDILRNKLYKNPILAVCREYCMNARDAHIEAGTKSRPVEITLPSSFERVWRVRDYGPGISPSRMDDIFVNYGASTKREDNSQHGGFGIGAKSAFAYSDTFTVITIVDGIRYTYSAYIDETQVGAMALLSKEETDEPSGTEIIIGVERGDEGAFCKNTMNVTKHWDVKPIIKGVSPPPEHTKYTSRLEGTGWKIVDIERGTYDDYYRNDGTKAILDGIEYKVEPGDLNLDWGSPRYNLLNSKVLLYFNVGDLSLSANRDNLHYDEKTKGAILRRADKIIQEAKNIVTEQVEKAGSFKEACKTFFSARDNMNLSCISNMEAEWNGLKLCRTVKLEDIGTWAKLSTYYRNPNNQSGVSYTAASKYKSSIYHLHDDFVVYLSDKRPDGKIYRYEVEYLFKLHKDAEKIQFISTPAVPNDALYDKLVEEAKQNNTDEPEVKYNDDLIEGVDAISLASVSIPKAAKKSRSGTGRTRSKLKDGHIPGYTLEIGNRHSIKKKSAQFDTSEERVYLIVDNDVNRYYDSADNRINSTKLTELNQLVFGSGYYDPIKIVAISKHKKGKIPDSWIIADKFLEKKVEKILENISVDELEDLALNTLSLERDSLLEFIFDNNGIFNNLDKDSTLQSLLDKACEVQELSKIYTEETYKLLIKANKYSADKPHPALGYWDKEQLKEKLKNTKISKLSFSCKKKYPLLGHIRPSNSIVKHVVDYVNAIELKEKQSTVTNN